MIDDDLFTQQLNKNLSSEAPLADRMRPKTFADFFGQDEIVGEGKILKKLVDKDDVPSMIFWGPPGVGKTTLARLIAAKTNSVFVSLSAVSSGLAELRALFHEAEERRKLHSQRTIFFIDEIHRWNKAQQDALLPYVEKGVVTLIGATTENPSFEVIGALLSRTRVFILKHLDKQDIVKIIKRATKDEKRGLGKYKVVIGGKTIELLAELAGGDARVALNGLELAVKAKWTSDYRLQTTEANGARGPKSETKLNSDDIKEALQKTHLLFDKKGEEFYNLISALHKSMRGSDANAALYWLARMLEGGADPLYVARRVLRFASEDIGMANSEALIQANAAYDACHKIGMPECSVHLAQAVVYCAKSAKSNLLYTAYSKAAEDAKNTSHLGVPLHLRNLPAGRQARQFMKEIGYR